MFLCGQITCTPGTPLIQTKARFSSMCSDSDGHYNDGPSIEPLPQQHGKQPWMGV